MKYIKKHFKYLLCLVLIYLAFNLYFIFLIPNTNLQLLIYLDTLLIICLLIFIAVDIFLFYKKQNIINEYLKSDEFIIFELENLENQNVIEHDFDLFHQKLNEQITIQRDLQDFITKWCHEVKIPLSVAMLMNEKMEDSSLKLQLKEQLEKIKQYLNSALVSCKIQGNFDDVQIHKIKLKECVNTSIKNNRYFLMNEKVDLQIKVHDEYVYSDKTWLVYIIDRLIANAIKYANDKVKIEIYSKQENETIKLYIKDYGEGIKDYDLPRIFERGYVGSNHHNGKYKSTGMGLYMVDLMVKKLGHQIEVESEYQHYTCFCITFKNIAQYFNL